MRAGGTSVAGRLLARLGPGAALVTVSDLHPATLSWLSAVAHNPIAPLGVERFGQSGDMPDLYHAYGIDGEAILDAAARACLLVAGLASAHCGPAAHRGGMARQLEALAGIGHLGAVDLEYRQIAVDEVADIEIAAVRR